MKRLRAAWPRLCVVVALGAAFLAACSESNGDDAASSSSTGGRGDGGSVGSGASSATGGASQSSGGASSGGTPASGAAPGEAGSGNSAGAGGSLPDEPEPELVPLTVFVAGDSTVSTYVDTASPGDQAGWGQMLHEYLNELVTVDNRAVGGRTSRRFIEEGRLDDIWADIAQGDYLLVQFGTNDSNKNATYTLDGKVVPYYLEPNTDFKTYLMQYIDGARSRGAVPVLVTPPPRNSAYCTGGNGTGAYAQAMRDLGASEDVSVLDLNARAVAYLKAICPSPTPEDFFLLRADGTVDGTHFQENGARKLAGFIALELGASDELLANYLK